MSSAAAVAVVVPVYNRARTVLRTLDSVAAQTAPPGRLVVVDDGSHDGTRESVERWSKEEVPDLEVAVLGGDHRGAAAARNRGTSAAPDAAYFAFLDSDDVWPDDFLARTTAALAAAPDAVAVSGDQIFVSRRRGERPRSLAGLAGDATTWLLLHSAGIASASLFRAEPVRRLGGFPEDLPTGHDLALFLSLSLAGPWLHVAGAPVTMTQGQAARAGEQPNLSHGIEDRQRRWAEIADRFVTTCGDDRFGRAHPVRRALARRWRRAGARLAASGRLEEARDCYRRSGRWSAWNRAWLRLALSYLPGAR